MTRGIKRRGTRILNPGSMAPDPMPLFTRPHCPLVLHLNLFPSQKNCVTMNYACRTFVLPFNFCLFFIFGHPAPLYMELPGQWSGPSQSQPKPQRSNARSLNHFDPRRGSNPCTRAPKVLIPLHHSGSSQWILFITRKRKRMKMLTGSSAWVDRSSAQLDGTCKLRFVFFGVSG